MIHAYIGRCRACKGAARIACDVEARELVGDYGRRRWHSTVTAPNGARYAGTDIGDRAFFPCLCGRPVEFRRLRGVKTAHKCGARCLSSTSGVCECSCGGANHGGSYA